MSEKNVTRFNQLAKEYDQWVDRHAAVFQCSGLDIVQYDSSSIQREFGDEFILLESQSEIHHTPAGKEQHFIYFVFQRK